MIFGHVEVNIIMIMLTPRDRSRDHSQIEVNIGLCKPLFSQLEAGILVGGMTKICYYFCHVLLCRDNLEHITLINIEFNGRPYVGRLLGLRPGRVLGRPHAYTPIQLDPITVFYSHILTRFCNTSLLFYSRHHT